jgi:pimeloyl-ACP methyl ester carboxylesterase
VGDRVRAPDYRGLGESADLPAAADLDDHLDDLEDLCDALGWEEFAVIGQATGATLALLLATRLPDRVVALAAGDAAVSLRADVFTESADPAFIRNYAEAEAAYRAALDRPELDFVVPGLGLRLAPRTLGFFHRFSPGGKRYHGRRRTTQVGPWAMRYLI